MPGGISHANFLFLCILRYKEFNPNVVLEKCITLFWNKGYGSCSISEIVEETGVNRFSLYNTFEKKEGILIAALKLYYERYGIDHLALLVTEKPLRQSLADFYMSFLVEKNGRPAGCFIVHTATELADANSEVKRILDEFIHAIEERLDVILERHNQTKENSLFFKRQFIGLFCTSISFCLIHDYDERVRLIENGIHVILDKNMNYAQST